MNLFFKYIPGSVTYKAVTDRSSKKAAQLMASFPDSVFDLHITDENSFVFSCVAFADKRVLSCDIISECEVSKLASRGLVYFILKQKKRAGLLLGIAMFILILSFQDTVVWDIQVSGNNTVKEEEIIGLLDEKGFSVGKRINREKLTEIENKCILSDERLSWISINMSGTVAFVEVKERSIKSDLSETPSMTGIVASKDCVIELCEVTSGTSLVSSGQTVQKGDILISPVALGKDGNEYLVGAYGSIFAKTIEDFCVVVNYSSTACSFTGETTSATDYKFLGKQITVKPAFAKNINRFIAFRSKEKIQLWKGVTLPVTRSTKEKYEYILSEEIITPQMARNKAYSKMYSKISGELPDAEILSSNFTETENDDSFILRCRVECIRDVAVFGNEIK